MEILEYFQFIVSKKNLLTFDNVIELGVDSRDNTIIMNDVIGDSTLSTEKIKKQKVLTKNDLALKKMELYDALLNNINRDNEIENRQKKTEEAVEDIKNMIDELFRRIGK